MVHGDEAGGEDTADVFHVLEAQRRLRELTIGYLAVYHLIDGFSDRFFGEFVEAT